MATASSGRDKHKEHLLLRRLFTQLTTENHHLQATGGTTGQLYLPQFLAFLQDGGGPVESTTVDLPSEGKGRPQREREQRRQRQGGIRDAPRDVQAPEPGVHNEIASVAAFSDEEEEDGGSASEDHMEEQETSTGACTINRPLITMHD